MNFFSPFQQKTVTRGALLLNLFFLLPFLLIVSISAQVESAYAAHYQARDKIVAISTWTVIVHEDVTDGYNVYHVYTVYSRLTNSHLASFATMEAAEAFVAVYQPTTTSLRITHEPSPHRTDWVSPVHH